MDINKLNIAELKELQDRVKIELDNRQTSCNHKRIIYKYDSNTGNYSESDNCYWVTVECVDCGKVSTYYDHEDEYKMKYIGEDLKVTKEEWEVLQKFNKTL